MVDLMDLPNGPNWLVALSGPNGPNWDLIGFQSFDNVDPGACLRSVEH
jgi:hypothetical protein